MRDCDLEHPDITRALKTGYPWGYDDDFYGEPYDSSEYDDPRIDETVEAYYAGRYE